MSAAQQRNHAVELAARHPDRALAVAREIADPWYRCQALSSVARHFGSESARRAVLAEAFVAAGELTEPNRVVTASAWPLKVLALTGETARLEVEANRLLTTIARERSPVRRGDALSALCGAVITGPHPLVVRVLHALIAACLEPLQNGKRNRKGESLLVSVLPAIQRMEPGSVDGLLSRLTPAHRDQALTRLAAAQTESLSEIVPWPNV